MKTSLLHDRLGDDLPVFGSAGGKKQLVIIRHMQFLTHQLLSFLIQMHEGIATVIGTQNTFSVGILQISRKGIINLRWPGCEGKHR